ncbi:MAG: hypothetical protein PHD10_03395 [Bacilli bacterium]|nr:hypothetical protein [Bacilli bacterium]MDD4608157.1 hypothetical protein [Bacilli bacterium]
MDNYVGKMVQMDDTTYMIIWIQEIDNVIYGYLVNGDNYVDSFFGVININNDNIDCIPIVNQKIVDKLVPLFQNDLEKTLENMS